MRATIWFPSLALVASERLCEDDGLRRRLHSHMVSAPVGAEVKSRVIPLSFLATTDKKGREKCAQSSIGSVQSQALTDRDASCDCRETPADFKSCYCRLTTTAVRCASLLHRHWVPEAVPHLVRGCRLCLSQRQSSAATAAFSFLLSILDCGQRDAQLMIMMNNCACE